MSKNNIKKSVFSKLRNNFIAGIVVLIPIGITLYLTLFIIRISGKVIPKEINPNNYFLKKLTHFLVKTFHFPKKFHIKME